GPVMNCIGNISFVIVAAFGGYFAHRGLISIGVISAFIVYVRQCSRPINELAFVYGQLQTALAGAERVFRVLEEKEEQAEGAELAIEGQAGLDFSHVNFSYNEGQPVLKDFCLQLPPGKMVALVGATGCGKTTVVNLLMRFYEPDSGSISINGMDIAQCSRQSLRRNLAIVLQDTVLFSDSIRANLEYGNPDASEEQLNSAMELSGCRDFIEDFPDRERTFLTGAGSSLSQGQRQLLAIARAFVANPKILILDEATSNVDTRTEKAIQEAMRTIMKERTGIVIAHRISTIRNADMIIVMENGAVVERGRHKDLLQQHGKYYELYMTQYAGQET
ncbi:MAG: ABC transporter ATP-binding protein, partial [Victivallales bacterium]|nr:ABC transporter ATP-binding protein [Victivallales bacterium]